MSAFTDEDVKQAKLFAELRNKTPIDLMALLARLEAAEACIIPGELIGSLEEKYEAWRKAAGK